MDFSDFSILSILNRNSRRSYLDIGKEIGLSGTAVRRRVENMVGSGLIHGFSILFDPSLLGLSTCIASVKSRGEAPRKRVIDELGRIGNIHFVTCATDNTLTMQLHYANSRELERAIDRIGEIKDVVNVDTGIPRSHLSTDIALSSMDWRIINSLNHDARKRNHIIAGELEISPKTVKRRLDRLVSEKVITFAVDVDLSRARGLVIYILVVELKTGINRKDIDREIKRKNSTIWSVAGSVHPSIILFMYAQQLSQIEEAVEGIKMMAGVRRVHASLYTSYHRFPDWLDRRIEKMSGK